MYRRRFVAGSVVGISFLSGCLQRSVQQTKDFVERSADRPSVRIDVAPDETFGFVPGTDQPVRIEPGTAVTFVWKTDGHNILVTRQPDTADWTGHRRVENAGFTTTHVFEEPGRYEFVCEPHEAVGATGTIIVGHKASNTDETPIQGSSATVRVAPGGRYGFVPGTDDPLSIRRGTMVTFEWESDDHNIVVESQPDGAHWKGTAGGPGTLYDSGYIHTHTFEIEGRYEFFCAPHKALYPNAVIRVVSG